MTRGEQFVNKYPLMFTEDKEWWAQELDSFFFRGNNYMPTEKAKDLTTANEVSNNYSNFCKNEKV